LKKRLSFLLFWSILFFQAQAQFPPPAGVEGTTAIHADSSIFVAWASQCIVERGFVDISQPELGFVDFGESGDALNKANNTIVSLGDGGMAILEFPQAIINSEGPDFAIFENAFSNEFLELALVYVSSNGVDYELFPAISNTQIETQIEGFGTIDATKIHNLAGKYRMNYGTPFNLSDLSGELSKQGSKISHIKIVDVVGIINEDYAHYDAQNNIINDPWPTPFPSGGFDLDAVGVIHQATGLMEENIKTNLIFPNPNQGSFKIKNPPNEEIIYMEIFHLNAKKLKAFHLESTTIHSHLPKGIYVLVLHSEKSVYRQKMIVL